MENESTNEPQSNSEHPCVGFQEGDWIIYTCPICKEYERRVNWKTNEVIVKPSPTAISHYGSHSPIIPDIEPLIMN